MEPPADIGPTVEQLDGASPAALGEYLGHPDPRVRADAACALGDRLRVRELVGLEEGLTAQLAELLRDAFPIVRLEAAIALAEARDARATPVLLAALSQRAFRLDAIRALAATGDPAALPALRKVLGRWSHPWADRLQAAAALCALGDAEGQRYLEGKLAARRRAERAAAIHFLGEAKHPRAAALLTALLGDATEPMRDVAARALGWLGDPATVAALEAARATADAELQYDIDQSLRQLASRT